MAGSDRIRAIFGLQNANGSYIDFLERKEMLKGLKMDLKALQVEEVFSDLGERLSQLRETSEVLRSELEGLSELLVRNSRKNITIH